MLHKGDSDEHIGQDAAIDNRENVEDDDIDVDDNQPVLSRVELARSIRESILLQVML